MIQKNNTLLLLLTLCVLSGGCAWLKHSERQYEQGNINLSLIQKKLAIGMSRNTIINQFGMPILQLPQHENRLIYFGQKTLGEKIHTLKLTLFFKKGKLIRSKLDKSSTARSS
jgi:outer membrane protein assembly factor BamE (lipoprotein component of BamABCDE complex)